MKRHTLLIADDDQQVVRLIVEKLTENRPKLRIIRANNGLEACRIAEAELPDLILMDWEMPILNGIEAIRRLKKNPVTSEIPVIMATGEMTSSENLQIALEVGAWDYVRKPIDFVELNARINATIRLREQQQVIRDLMKSDIDLKNRKLSTTSMLIVEKNTLIQEFDQEIGLAATPLEKAHDLSTRESQLLAQINKLRKRIKHHLETDDSWVTFKVHFEEVHPNFFQKLTSTNGPVSHKDLKLCAYLKLNMDTKEIAQLLNVTPASVRTAMYRVKKRLNLEEDDNLRDYLHQLN